MAPPKVLPKLHVPVPPAAPRPASAVRSLTGPLKELSAPPPARVQDLFFSPRGGTHWEPDTVFRIIAREWAPAAELLPWTPAQLKDRLGRSLDVPPDVLVRSAQRMGADPREFEAYLSARPWDLEVRLPPAEPRSVADNHDLLRAGGLRSPVSFEPTRPVNLDEQVRRSGLSPDQLNLILLSSRGIFDVEDFLARAPSITAGHAGRDGFAGYALGVGNIGAYTDARFAYQNQLRHWVDGYARDLLGGPPRPTPPQTERYMDLITSSDDPIVFLVPPDIMSDWYRHSITRSELDWLLANPERMRNVHFVFGAYEQT